MSNASFPQGQTECSFWARWRHRLQQGVTFFCIMHSLDVKTELGQQSQPFARCLCVSSACLLRLC